jgi:hypothetical protein
VVSFTFWQPYSKEKSPWDPLDRRITGPQIQSGSSGEEKNPYPSWELDIGRPAPSLVTILTKLSGSYRFYMNSYLMLAPVCILYSFLGTSLACFMNNINNKKILYLLPHETARNKHSISLIKFKF